MVSIFLTWFQRFDFELSDSEKEEMHSLRFAIAVIEELNSSSSSFIFNIPHYSYSFLCVLRVFKIKKKLTDNKNVKYNYN